MRDLSVASSVAALLAAYTASYAVGVVWVALTVATIGAYRAPDFVFEAPDPAFERGKIVEDGLTDREVMRRFAIHTEREDYRAEKIQEERKRSERKAKARQGKF